MKVKKFIKQNWIVWISSATLFSLLARFQWKYSLTHTLGYAILIFICGIIGSLWGRYDTRKKRLQEIRKARV
jgi:hypothetical protein